MNRDEMLSRLKGRREPWDLVVIGGGATGAGVAVDAASRGYATALIEQHDFGKGTSSRSTKLIHGGMRYLRQGNIALVRDALRERALLRENAPHLVHALPFVVPAYRWWEKPYYGVGLRAYDLLAGRRGFGRCRGLSKGATVERLPTIQKDGLRGGVMYHDGQFDDARLLIALIRTACEHGATAANYVRADALTKNEARRVTGVEATDMEAGDRFTLPARVVVNAAGPFADGVRRLDQPAAEPMIAPSQGTHIVLGRSALPGDTALIVPKTPDGRVLFAIPWHGHTLVGTTDTPVDAAALEPRPLKEEVAFILETLSRYLTPEPTADEVTSVFAGIRPLARAGDGDDTASLSRDHVMATSPSGMLTVVGGKWTTYRRMAQDTVDRAAVLAELPARPCQTESLRIHGWRQIDPTDEFGPYGSDAESVRQTIESKAEYQSQLHPSLPYRLGEAAWAARHEMARTVEDVLARRTRLLPLNADAAMAAAPAVAEVLAEVLGRDEAWRREQVEQFTKVARGYQWDAT